MTVDILSPAEIKSKALKIWESQRFLRAWLEGECLFPIELSVRVPGGSALIERFDEIRSQLEQLKDNPCYRVVEQVIRHRQLGEQRIPSLVLIEREEDFLRLISKQQAHSRFRRLARETRNRLPALEEFLRAKPLAALEQAEVWPQLLSVCERFRKEPRPGSYLRQLDIEGIDTKFIERHKGILAEMLPLVLPQEVRGAEAGGLSRHGFERRFGLAFEPPLIRFRILDAAIALSGLRDLSLPLVDFQQLALDVDRVFVTENKVNGLCFPNVPCSIVVFGLGYGIQSLADITWLKDKPIVYWGDLDTHGFAMLSQLRGYYPQVRSILMDFETLLSNRALWGQEPKEKRSLQDLEHLSPEETVLFSQLRDDVHGERVRLEQERIPFHRLKKALAQDVPLSQ